MPKSNVVVDTIRIISGIPQSRIQDIIDRNESTSSDPWRVCSNKEFTTISEWFVPTKKSQQSLSSLPVEEFEVGLAKNQRLEPVIPHLWRRADAETLRGSNGVVAEGLHVRRVETVALRLDRRVHVDGKILPHLVSASSLAREETLQLGAAIDELQLVHVTNVALGCRREALAHLLTGFVGSSCSDDVGWVIEDNVLHISS